jgi:hypothetical protein
MRKTSLSFSLFFYMNWIKNKQQADVLQKSAEGRHRRPIPSGTSLSPPTATFSGDRQLNPVKPGGAGGGRKNGTRDGTGREAPSS